MRRIVKLPEPNSLTQHRAAAHADYDNYADKAGLRASLETEQRGLCCYCMGRIEPDSDSMKIEHWHSQRNYPGEQLAYRNLLGACLGGRSQAPRDQHCDTKKGDLDFSLNPADPHSNIEARIRYLADGTITSHDKALAAQLDNVLNLNHKFLMNNRKAVLDAFQRRLQVGPLTANRVQAFLGQWNGDAPGRRLEPYCQVIVYWLRKKLDRIG